MKGRKLPESVRRKISLAQKGKNNSFFGKKHTKVTLEKISKATRGKNNPMYGKKHTAATKRKIGLLAKKRAALKARTKSK